MLFITWILSVIDWEGKLEHISVIFDCETVRKIVFYTVKYLKSHFGYCICYLVKYDILFHT